MTGGTESSDGIDLFEDHPRRLGSKIRNEGYRAGCDTCGWTGELVENQREAYGDALDHDFAHSGEGHVTYVEECNRLAGSDQEPAWSVETDTEQNGGEEW